MRGAVNGNAPVARVARVRLASCSSLAAAWKASWEAASFCSDRRLMHK